MIVNLNQLKIKHKTKAILLLSLGKNIIYNYVFCLKDQNIFDYRDYILHNSDLQTASEHWF